VACESVRESYALVLWLRHFEKTDPFPLVGITLGFSLPPFSCVRPQALDAPLTNVAGYEQRRAETAPLEVDRQQKDGGQIKFRLSQSETN
jgi:hypothetical protein